MLWWTLRQLKKQLTSDNSETRIQAAQKLGEIKDSRAVEPLIAALKDRRVQEAAIVALGKIGDARALEPLIAALKDIYSDVRWWAAYALGKIGDARAVESLIAALKDSDSDVGAAEALGKIGDTRAVEPLMSVLEDGNGEWRSRARVDAARALGEIGDARAVGPLIQSVSDKWVSEFAVESLKKLLERYASEVSEDDLHATISLSDVVEYSYSTAGACQTIVSEKVSCSLVRQLARQELIRRGLEV